MTCELCGESFQSADRGRRFCGRGCSQKFIARTRRITPRPVMPWLDRFNASFQRAGDACWLWTGAANKLGYGATAWKDSPECVASRLSWHVHRGPIPEGLMVLHKCDTPRCVNPDHLFLGDKSDNAKDYVDKGLMKHLHRRNTHGQWTVVG